MNTSKTMSMIKMALSISEIDFCVGCVFMGGEKSIKAHEILVEGGVDIRTLFAIMTTSYPEKAEGFVLLSRDKPYSYSSTTSALAQKLKNTDSFLYNHTGRCDFSVEDLMEIVLQTLHFQSLMKK